MARPDMLHIRPANNKKAVQKMILTNVQVVPIACYNIQYFQVVQHSHRTSAFSTCYEGLTDATFQFKCFSQVKNP